MQTMDISRNKVAALEDVNQRSSETLESQVLAWKDERERLLELMSELENNSNAKDGKVQGLQQKLSMAECAVEQLNKSRAEMQEEVLRMQVEMAQTHDKLTELECASLLLQKTKENEIGSLVGSLQAKNIAFENALADLAEKKTMIDELSTQLSSFQAVQQQYTLLQQECLDKTQGLQALSESHKGLKHHLQAIVEGHEREMDCISRKLQEALDSHASKDSRIETLTSELNGLQLALKNAGTFNTRADFECSKLKEDLAMAKDAQNYNHLSLEKAVKEAAALREALMAKDDLVARLKIQEMNKEKAHQQKRESLEEELQKYQCMEKELRLNLEEEQRKFTVLEDLRNKDLEAAKIQEMGWRDEREKLITDLSSMHNLIKMKEILAQEREEKLSRADDAIRHVTESRAGLQEEISDLRMQMQEVQVQLRDAESGLELMEKKRKDELLSLSNLLQAKQRDLEVSQQAVVQHQKTITAMAADLVSLQRLQEEHASFKEALKIKEEEVHALSSSQERSRLQLKAMQDEHDKDHDNLVVQLEKALECKEKTEKNLEESQNELGCLRVAMHKANVSRTESKSETERLLDSLARLQDENFILQRNLHLQEERSLEVTEALKESMSRKENDLQESKRQVADLEVTLSHAMQQEQQWQDGVAECEALRRELKEKCLLHSELHELYQKASLQWSEKENSWFTEMESLNSRAHTAEENLTAANSELQTAHSDLQCLKLRCTEYEQKTTAYENEIAQLHLKLDESNAHLQSMEKEFQNLQDKLHLTSSSFTELLQKKDSALSDAKKKLDELHSEVVLRSNKNIIDTEQIDFFKKKLQVYEVKIKDMEESVTHLKKSLLEKVEEIAGATEMNQAIEANLSNTREELRLVKSEYELQMQMLKETLSASEGKLEQTLESMRKKEEEMEALLTCLENRESSINEMKTSNLILLQEKEVLNQSVIALQSKTQMLALALENERTAMQQLCSCVEEKDRTIASRSEEVRDLQHLLDLSKSESQKVSKYEDKLRSLEDELAEACASMNDREERLIASEWAVQQLANEVAKAKSNLAQKEREEVLLHSRLSDMETRSKAKEREFVELDCYVQSLVKKNSQKQSEIERLTQAVEKFKSRVVQWEAERQELMSEMGQIGITLQDKITELVHLEEQLKQGQLRENMMEDAIQCLKSQLADRALQLVEQESRAKQLAHELETAHTKEGLMAASLMEAESKLRQADQRFRDLTENLKTDLLETQEKLSSSLTRQSGLERDLVAALEETEEHKGKLCSLSEIAGAKDCCLKEMNCKLDTLQRELEEQKQLMNQTNEELQHTKEERDFYTDKEKRLNEKIRLLSDKMQEQKETLTNRLSTMGDEMLLKDEEIQQLKVIQQNMQLSALEETEEHKGKLCSLSEIAAAKDCCLKEMNCKLDTLQRELEEQKELMNQTNEELQHTKEERDFYTDKEKRLNEKIRLLSEKMQEQKETLTNRLSTMGDEVLLKDEEIQQLKVIQQTMQLLSTENGTLNDEVIKLRKELDSSSKIVQEREAELTRLKETRKNLKGELAEVREDILKKEEALENTFAKLNTAEENCRALEDKFRFLEGELGKATSELRTQVGEIHSLAAVNSHLKEELEDKQNMLKAVNTQSRSALDDLNYKLVYYCTRETALEGALAVLLKNMRELLYISRQHEAEGIQCLKSESLAILEQEFSGKELAEVIEHSEQMGEEPEKLHGPEIILALQTVMQELQTEEQRRSRMEASVTEMTRNAVLKVAAKDQEIQGLIVELKKNEGDWGKWLKEVLSAQQELEKEGNMVMTLTHAGEAQLQSRCAVFSLQAEASITDMYQLIERWKLISNMYKDCALLIVRTVRNEVASSSCTCKEVSGAMLCSDSWAQELQHELTRLKQIMKLLLEELHQKDSALSDAVKTVERLRSSLQEEAEKEKGAQEQALILQLSLKNSQSALNKGDETIQHLSASSMDLHTEIEICKGEAILMDNASLRSQLGEASLLAEELNRDIKFKAKETDAELARWREEAERALNLNHHFTEQVTELQLKIKSFETKEQCMGGELEDVRAQLEALEDVASNYRMQLTKAAEKARYLELQIDTKEEEFKRMQAQMNDLKLSLEVVTGKNRDVTLELAMANKQIEGLQLKVGNLEEEQAGIHTSLEEWKERASLAHDKMLALQSEVVVATQSSQQRMEHIEAEKHRLQLELQELQERAELSAQDNNLLRSQLEKFLQATDELQRRLETAENAKQVLQNMCQSLEAELVCAQDANRQREKLLGDALTKLQEGPWQTRMAVDARLQALYNAMIHEDNGDENMTAHLRCGRSDTDKDDISSTKIGCQMNDLKSSGATYRQRVMDDADGCSKECANSPLHSASELSPAKSFKVEEGQGTKESQHELDHYLELCDSLIRRHARLEKQLDNLVTSTSGQNQHKEGISGEAGMADETGDSENKKKRLLTSTNDWQGKGATRKPLQPILSQVAAVATTPSPCAKRRRSNNSSSSHSFQDQNNS